MTHSNTVRSIRNRLFLLLLRAFIIAVVFLILFTLLATGLVLSNPSQSNPLYQLRAWKPFTLPAAAGMGLEISLPTRWMLNLPSGGPPSCWMHNPTLWSIMDRQWIRPHHRPTIPGRER
jgi:hypothetical protein